MFNITRNRLLRQGRYQWLLLAMLLYLAIVGAYFVIRFDGRWMENDSSVLTQAIQTMVHSGRLAPDGENDIVYANGYAYQAISVYIVNLTGLNVLNLQQLVYPVLSALIVLPAFLLYRELTGSARYAIPATILLFTQPEFLFVTLRSSHEKFTRILAILCLYLLVRSFKLSGRFWHFAVYVGLFYLCTFALISSNELLAHSFIFSIVIALILNLVLQRRNPTLRTTQASMMQRFTYVVLISLGLVYLFIFNVYPPAEQGLYTLRSIWDRVAALFLDVETQANNSYAQVQTGWVSLPAYFAVSIANWIVLGASFVIWCRQSLRWVWRRETPPSREAWITWLLYTSYAAQGVLSATVDASGALGSNLQHRLFPSFSMIAVAMVGVALAEWRPRRFVQLGRAGIAITIGVVAILSVFKATNEPALSNKWTFYHDGEIAALDWTNTHLQNADIWTEFDDRLSAIYATRGDTSASNNTFHGFGLRADTRAILVSSVTRLRALRLEQPLPVPPDALQVYDNGEAQLYRLRAQTVYQR